VQEPDTPASRPGQRPDRPDRRARPRAVPTGLACLALLAGCSSVAGVESSPEPETPVLDVPEADGALLVDFDETVAEHGAALSGAENRGSAVVRVWVSAVQGGRVRSGAGPFGSVAVFPSRGEEGAAALVVVPVDDPDPLAPGPGGFVLGADVRLDEGVGDPEAEAAAAEHDNGENLVQRGLYSHPAQYKLQLDHGTASCVVRGDAGETKVSLPERLRAETWYRLRCVLAGDELSLQARDVHGVEPDQDVTVPAGVGTVAFPAGLPLAVGAKVGPDGQVPASSTDQLNGSVDHVYFRQLD